MPSPTERSGRCKPSPLPTYTVFGSDGATATAPMDVDAYFSKELGLNVREASVVG